VRHIDKANLRYPNLSRGCVGAWVPLLGKTGMTLRDTGPGRYHAPATNFNTDTMWAITKGYHSVQWASATIQYCKATLPATNIFDMGLNPFTLSCWCVVSSATNFPYLILKGDWLEGGSTTNYGIGINSNTIRILCGTATVTVAHTYTADLLHICGTFAGGASGTLRLFKNGTEITSGAGPASSTAEKPYMIIGGLRPSSDSFAGNILEASVYNRLLTNSEITLLSSRPGISYETTHRRSYKAVSASAFRPAWASQRTQMIGGGNR
jgi:hypothetical protein